MGLDITYYKRVSKIEPALFDAYGSIVDAEGNEIENSTRLYANPDFHAQFEGLDADTAYAYEDSNGFRAGSYGGYNGWRNWLATIGGWASANEAWNATSGPFWELVNFSDCEGTIGPVVAAKLAADFAKYDERAKLGDEWQYRLYREWRTACEWAADHGAISFH